MPGALSLGVKLKEREADRSSPFSTGAKNGGAIPPLQHTSSCILLIYISTGITLPIFAFVSILVHWTVGDKEFNLTKK
jgi:hypothetical protein